MTTATSPSGTAPVPVTPPASSPAALVVLTKRADFLRAAQARRQAAPGFLLQARKRGPAETPQSPDIVRIGYTCSKKVGNAVARNRAKRRLREIARLELPQHGTPGWDYVLIGRRDTTASRAFAELRCDMVAALARIHGAGPSNERRSRSRKGARP